MELEMEKVYWPSCLVSKKRYVGYCYASPTQAKPSLDAKGIETVRRDVCRWTQKNMEKILHIMFSGVPEHLMGKLGTVANANARKMNQEDQGEAGAFTSCSAPIQFPRVAHGAADNKR
ncbi:unnamed protein product, partial [Amoebophrya sp. A25]|eukprot:GSA25T00017145001.1